MARVLSRLIVGSLVAWTAAGADLTLSWNANPDSKIAGYTLYQGDGNAYTNAVDCGLARTNTVRNLHIGTLYSFAVTAYYSNRVESDFSPALIYTVPTMTTNTIYTLWHATDPAGPWTAIVSATNPLAPIGFFKTTLTVNTNAL